MNSFLSFTLSIKLQITKKRPSTMFTSSNNRKSLLFFVTILINVILNHVSATIMPTFDRQSENVTVIIGNSVVLPCFISNLGDHKVS
jgi:hypothetical protein